jgi:hypothetical protein
MEVFNIGPMSDDGVKQILQKGTHSIGDDLYEARMVEAANGNPGAATVIGAMHLVDQDRAALCMGKLAAYRISGPLLWLCYKDLNDQNAEKLMGMIEDGDTLPVALSMLHYSEYKWPLEDS